MINTQLDLKDQLKTLGIDTSRIVGRLRRLETEKKKVEEQTRRSVLVAQDFDKQIAAAVAERDEAVSKNTDEEAVVSAIATINVLRSKRDALNENFAAKQALLVEKDLSVDDFMQGAAEVEMLEDAIDASRKLKAEIVAAHNDPAQIATKIEALHKHRATITNRSADDLRSAAQAAKRIDVEIAELEKKLRKEMSTGKQDEAESTKLRLMDLKMERIELGKGVAGRSQREYVSNRGNALVSTPVKHSSAIYVKAMDVFLSQQPKDDVVKYRSSMVSDIGAGKSGAHPTHGHGHGGGHRSTGRMT